MRTLFIATDFSEASRNAALFGVELATLSGWPVVLAHGYRIPLSVPESYVVVDPVEVRKTAENYLQEEKEWLRARSTCPIEIRAIEGDTPELLLREAAGFVAPLMVVGMKGEGKRIRRLFGSTSSGLARKADVPVLIVPEKASFRGFIRMALAVEDSASTESDTIDPLLELGSSFHSKLYLVHVLKSDINEVEELGLRSVRILQQLKALDPEYQFPRAADVSTGLNDFASEFEIDLLAVMPHKHNFLERVFLKSETRALVFHSSIPLLVLPSTASSRSPEKAKRRQRQHT